MPAMIARLVLLRQDRFPSDWPVCLLAASYDQVVDALAASLPPEWTDAEKEGVFGANAAAFYGIRTQKR